MSWSMATFPSRAQFEAAVAAGNALLARRGFREQGRADELEAWLRTDTPYPNPEPVDLLDSPFLVVHEILEIAEAKRKGLRITKDVIVRNMEAINDAHLVAAEAELRIAAAEGDVAYVRSRFEDLRRWCEDPLLSARQKAAYESLRDRVARWLAARKQKGNTEEL